MITVGIDVGFENTKVIILQDGKIVGRGKGESGGIGRNAAAERILKEALDDAGLDGADIGRIAATGKGKVSIEFADDRITEVLSSFQAARFLYPEAGALVDTGADETLAMTYNDARVIEMVINQKCSAGLGSFLSYMGRRLELTPEEMCSLDRPSGEAALNEGCVVFAELDALGLLNRGVLPREVASLLTDAAAVRASSVIVDLTLPVTGPCILVGGLAKNVAFVNALKLHSGLDFLIHEEAEYAGAIGAALFAAVPA